MNFEVELEAETMLEESVDELISLVGDDPKLTRILVDFVENKAEDELNWQIERDLNDFGKALLNEDSIRFVGELRKHDLDTFMEVRRKLIIWKSRFEQKVREMAVTLLSVAGDAGLDHESLYVTVTDAVADTVALARFKTSDAVHRLQVYQYPTSVQLTFKLSPDIDQVDPIVDQQTNNLLLALHSRAALMMQDKLQSARKRANLDVIVIDAGHGGKDPGTIGVAGTREKDVTLGVALKLGKLIEQGLKDVRVVYTRKTDVFVELGERAKIANKEN